MYVYGKKKKAGSVGCRGKPSNQLAARKKSIRWSMQQTASWVSSGLLPINITFTNTTDLHITHTATTTTTTIIPHTHNKSPSYKPWQQIPRTTCCGWQQTHNDDVQGLGYGMLAGSGRLVHSQVGPATTPVYVNRATTSIAALTRLGVHVCINSRYIRIKGFYKFPEFLRYYYYGGP